VNESPIGLVGVGLLGTALAERMLAAGHAVLGYDVRPARLAELSQLGGQAAADPAEIAKQCTTIVLCLPDSRVVAAAVELWGDRLRRGTLLIDSTTGDPDDSVALARRLAGCGVGYVDATIAGSSEQARQGEAVVLIGGQPTDVARAEAVLASWSARRFHVGQCGSASRLKLVVNLVLGLNRAALAEGLSLAMACGIDSAAALEVLKATPAYSAVMDTKGPRMIAGDFTPQARLAQHLKDVGLIRELARRHCSITPLSDVHEEMLRHAVALGLGDADNSAVLGVYSSAVARDRVAEFPPHGGGLR
jgi:3-hydroxyisobutyrate dehydrogenase-like beta-hydroxyacid dehydrogenase